MDNQTILPEVKQEYFDMRLNRIIVDYMLRQNFIKTAKIFIKEKKMEDYCDVKVH